MDKIEKQIEYNDRKKEMIHTVIETKEAQMEGKTTGQVIITSQGTYNEVGIKKIIQRLNQTRTQLEQKISQLKKTEKELPVMTPEMKELEKKIKSINDYNKGKKQVDELKGSEENLKEVVKSIKEIKDKIGDRLKL